MIKDYFKLAWENISHRKIRSWLTIIGIVIGIAAVVALISLGQGVKKVITDEFAKAGTDKIYILPGGGIGTTGAKGLQPLTEHDTEVIRRTKGVKEATGLLMKSGKIEYKKNVYFSTVVGLPLDESEKLIEESYNLEYVTGRALRSGDKYKVVIGSDIYKGKILGKSVSVGEKLTIEGSEFEVVGALKSMGDPGIDGAIIMPKETAQELFNVKYPQGHEESEIIARTEAGENPDTVAENIKRELRRSR